MDESPIPVTMSITRKSWRELTRMSHTWKISRVRVLGRGLRLLNVLEPLIAKGGRLQVVHPDGSVQTIDIQHPNS